jgi:[protein-PII] uridylyltransferase
LPDPWPVAARDAFVRLLLTGRSAVVVIEDLDQSDLWTAVLPEWALVRNRPQRNAYHRFTVDRHLVETAAEAAALTAKVDRPDLLVLGALLHDLGKGGGGDHRATGATLALDVMARLGFDPADVALVAKLVRHHLLLPEVATRRDLTDPATVAAVVAAVEDVETLHLLAALAEADGLATGPAAWSNWKAGLIGELVRLTEAALSGGTEAPTSRDELPNPEELELLSARRPAVRAAGTTLTVVARDRPGLFSRVAGVLALHGLQVVWAGAHTDDEGWALERFRVASESRDARRSLRPEERWDDVRRDLERVLDGRLALHARLAERARAYQPSTRPPRQIASRVVVDNEASTRATVLEVHAADSVGLLYRITAALADLDLDLRSARVETLGDEVVDVFYVRDVAGAKVVDPAYLAEIERALLFATAFA